MATLSQFTYKKKFKFPTNVVTISANETNFPHCLHISSSSWATQTERDHFFGDWNVNGKRCQFYDKDGNALKFEVEYYSSVNQEAIYWIKIPTVYSGDDGTNNYLYVGYGNDPNSADQDDKNNVWDTNFKGVWHLGDNSWGAAPEAKDSTINACNGTNVGSTDAEGTVRRGRSFDGNDYLDIPDSVNWDLGTGDFTKEIWVKRTTEGVNAFFSLHPYATRYVWYHNNGIINLYDGIGGANYGFNNEVTIALNVWAHLLLVRVSGVLKLAKNGAFTTTTHANTTNIINRAGIIIAGSGPGNELYTGSTDEPRISNVARSANWAKIDYYSMNKTNWNGDGWYSWNAEELNEIAKLYDLLGYASAGLLKLLDLKSNVEALAKKLLDLKVRIDAGVFDLSDAKAFMDAVGFNFSDVKSFADAGIYSLSDLKSFTDAGLFNFTDIKSAIEAHLLILSDVKLFVDATVSEFGKLIDIKMMAAAGLFGLSDIKSLVDAGFINFSDIKAFIDALGFSLSDVKVFAGAGLLSLSNIKIFADAGLINFSDIKSLVDAGIYNLSDIKARADAGLVSRSDIRSYISAAVERLENLKAQMSASLFKLLTLKADIGAASFGLKNLKVGTAAGIAYLEDLRTFITVTIRELLGPYVVRYPTPWLGQINREITEPVRFRVKDNGSGVNLGKLWIKVADVLYKPGEPEVSYIGNKNDYQFTVTPSSLFRYNQRVEVAIYAEDLLGNPGLELEPL